MIFEDNRKVTHGGLLILHTIIYIMEASFENILMNSGSYILAAIKNDQDEISGRFACGLVSDISNYLEKNMVTYSDDFMTNLNDVLSKPEYSTETKVHAMIAVGDICLAIEEKFLPYLDSSMECIISAAQIS